MRTGKNADALASFDAALALRKDHPLGQRLRAEALFRLGRFEEVIAAFDRYLEAGKPLESVYRGRGLARAELGQYPGAIEDFTKALELHPTSAVQAYRGWTYLVVDAPKLALRDFELAIELDPKNADAYNGRGFARAKLGQHREAVQDAAEALRLGPPSASLALQRRAGLRPVPQPLPTARAGVDPAGSELASRRGTPRRSGPRNIEKDAALQRAAQPTVVHHARIRAVWREMIDACSSDEQRAGLANRSAGSRSGCPTATGWSCARCSPPRLLSLAVPLHFGVLDDAEESHFLSTPGEVDLYSVALQQRRTLYASIDAQNSGSALTSLLRVFGPDGTALALDNQEGGDPQLTFQAATAGTYYIGVSSAPNNNYNPLVAGSGTAGGSTGLYTLDVRQTSGPLMPDLTGSSFRTGLDMAAAGETVPVSFTVQNRGGADPGNFQVQVLLAANNLFDSSAQVLATFTQVELVADATGRSFTSPAGFSVTVPAGWAVGAGGPGPAHRGRPGSARSRLVRQERRPSRLGLGALTVVTASAAGATDLSGVGARFVHGNAGHTERCEPGFRLQLHGQQHPGQRRVEGGGERHRAATCVPRLTLSGATGQVLIQSDSGQIVQSLAAGNVLAHRLARKPARGATGSRRRLPRPARLLPRLSSGAGTASVAVGDLNGDGSPDVVIANRVDDTVSVFHRQRRRHIRAPARLMPIGERVWRVTVADATGNGKLDILTANKGAEHDQHPSEQRRRHVPAPDRDSRPARGRRGDGGRLERATASPT